MSTVDAWAEVERAVLAEGAAFRALMVTREAGLDSSKAERDYLNAIVERKESFEVYIDKAHAALEAIVRDDIAAYAASHVQLAAEEEGAE